MSSNTYCANGACDLDKCNYSVEPPTTETTREVTSTHTKHSPSTNRSATASAVVLIKKPRNCEAEACGYLLRSILYSEIIGAPLASTPNSTNHSRTS